MKTKNLTLIALFAVIFGTATVAKATTIAGSNDITVLTNVGNISKIEASGNVEVYITNGDKDQVKIFDNYYTKNALVQSKDGVLRIASYSNSKLIVEVTVTDLREVAANNKAVV